MKEYYLSTSYKDLHALLKPLTLKSPKQSLKIVHQLIQSERFDQDEDFKRVVLTHKITAMSQLGMHKQILEEIDNAYDIVKQTKDTDVYIYMCNRFGIAYYEIGYVQKSIGLFVDIINLESDTNTITAESAVAYNNLGTLHKQYCQKGKARAYYLKAFDILNTYGSGKTTLFHTRYIYMASNIATIYAEFGDIKSCNVYIEKAKKHLPFTTATLSRQLIMNAQFSYDYLSGDFIHMHRHFTSLIDSMIYARAYRRIPPIIFKYNDYLIDIGDDRKRLIDTLERIIYLIKWHATARNLRKLYLITIDFYLKVGDYEKATNHYKYLQKILLDSEVVSDQQQINSINLRIELEKNKRNKDEITKQNQELIKLNTLKQQKRHQLKLMHDRLRLITKIGQRITSSYKIGEIESFVHEELSSIMTIDTIIFLIDYHDGTLKSTYLYRNHAIQPDYVISKNSKLSTIVKSFNQQQFFMSNDILKDTHLTDPLHNSENPNTMSRSVIYLPLLYNDTCIGVFTIQSKKVMAYTTEQIELLKQLVPYLTIAISNAMRTEEFNKEITNYDAITEQLEMRNQHLNELSNLDGLTKIANRRAFDLYLVQALNQMRSKKTPLHIFMIDIDDFKDYNDAYGHVAGDIALTAVANHLNSQFTGDNAMIARYGGEEFIAISTNESVKAAYDRGEMMRKLIEELKIINNDANQRYLTISIGIASATTYADNYSTFLIKTADDQLYKVKAAGKNKVAQKIIN